MLFTNKYYKSAQFVALQRDWARRLRASGFADLEYPDGTGDYRCLQSAVKTRLLARRIDDRSAEYYRLASRYYWAAGDSLSIRDREVWELHAEGRSIFEISSLLRSRHPRPQGVAWRRGGGRGVNAVRLSILRTRAAMRQWIETGEAEAD